MNLRLDWDAWFTRTNTNPEFKLVSRWSNVRLRLIIGGAATDLRLAASTLSRDRGGADIETVVLEGSATAWRDFLLAMPARHNHHILAMSQCRDDFQVAEGFHSLVRNLTAITVALEQMRATAVAARGSTA